MLGISSKIKKILLMIKWKQKYNNSNELIPKSIFSIDNVVCGKYSYGELNIISYNDNFKLFIGNYVSIARNVTFLLEADHYTSHISTYPFISKIIDQSKKEAISKGDIIIKDDVWIGYGATIMSGVTIEQGAVIAAGAVVTKNVPAYAIVGGIPAQIIRYRFSQELISELIKVDYGKLSKEMVVKNKKKLYENLHESKQLKWLPKKQNEWYDQ